MIILFKSFFFIKNDKTFSNRCNIPLKMSLIFCYYCGVSNTNEIMYNCDECHTYTCNRHNQCQSGCKNERLYAPEGSLPSSPFDTPPG